MGREIGVWPRIVRTSTTALIAEMTDPPGSSGRPSSDTSSPFSFDCGPPFELEAELAKEINRLSEVIDDDSYVVHPFERHVSNLPNLQVSSRGTCSAHNLSKRSLA
jgi:hypothetical protein